jgi:hypothetical protein
VRTIATVVCFALTATTAPPQTTAPAGTAQTSTPTAGSAAAQTPTGIPADQLLQRGKENYRASRYSDAAQDLRAAAAAFLSPEEKQRYIETGKLAALPQVEQSLVYLALAYSKLGKEAETRDAVMRLANAERITPTFAALPLDPDAADFAAVVARVAPGVNLPQNVQLARGGPAPVAPTAVAEAGGPIRAATTPAPVQTAQAQPKPVPASTQTAQVAPLVAPAAASPVTAANRAEKLRQIEQCVSEAGDEIEREGAARIAELRRQADARVAAEKAAAEKAAQERIAADRAAAQKVADERIAADRAAIQRDADAQIAGERAAAAKTAQEKSTADRASADRTAQERIAADRAASEKAAEVRIAADRAAVEKVAQERIAADRAAVQKAAEERAAADRAAVGQAPQSRTIAADSDQQRSWITSLRQADSLAQSGNLADANRTYVAVASASGSSREVIAAAAAGLYRTGDFRDAVAAFQRLGTFVRGEEDLRYYDAVSLFEVGRYYEARHELACALPYVQASSDVMRYRAKIEGMAAQRPMK